ncbi:MAG TPA: hypothetical protein PKN28_01100 [Clostridiales bacterium]|nr:hypothetical protein [Clostridiales bacterium]
METVKTTAQPPPLSDTETKPPQANTFEYSEYLTGPADLTPIIKRQKELLKLVNNKKPYDDLITKQVDINEFIRELSPSPLDYEYSVSLVNVDEKFGIECLRKKSGNYYSVHKLEQGGLIYIFYIEFETSKGRLLVHDWEISQKSLCYADFSAIVEGSKLEEVEAIDPITSIYKTRAEAYKISWDIFYSRHYLTDGIITVTYKNDNGKWVVTDTSYYKDFWVVHMSRGSNCDYKAKILGIDAIK